MFKTNKKIAILISSATLLVLPFIAFAIDPGTWINGILNRFLDYVVWPVFFGAAILMLIYSGLLFVTAQGDPSKITNARRAFLWAIVGIVVAIIAFSAVQIVSNVIVPSSTSPQCTSDDQCSDVENCVNGQCITCQPSGVFCSTGDDCCSNSCVQGSDGNVCF